jgi:hypothetical protein
MRVLVVAKPRGTVPPDQLPGLLDRAQQWYERYQDRFEVFGSFPGGGGFAALDVADEETLHQMVLEMPFSPFSELDITPYTPGDTGFRLAQQAFAAMSGAH